MSQERTFLGQAPMSALPPKADIGTRSGNVRFVPKADILRCNKERRYSITFPAARPKLGCASLARLHHEFLPTEHDVSGRDGIDCRFAAHALALGRCDTALCQRVR